MAPHEQRVVDEKNGLDEILAKLVSFITTSQVFAGLSMAEQSLLVKQRNAMQEYSDVLGQRIKLFEDLNA
jgi:F0F1-type ATP synthase gamma subunit